MFKSCMGGWCGLRDRCPHYHAFNTKAYPSERLCLPHRDGVSDVTHVRLAKLPESQIPVAPLAFKDEESSRIWKRA